MKNDLILIIITALALTSLSHKSHATALYVGGVSVHIMDPPEHVDEWNNANYFIGVEHDDWIGGTFYNSFEDWTVFGGYKIRAIQTQWVDVDLNVGLMYGYDPEDNDFLNWNGLQPMFAPEIKLNTPYVQPVMMFTGAALTFVVKYEF